MNALQLARQAIESLPALLQRTDQARQQAHHRTAIKPGSTQLRITGNAMVRIFDIETGRVLGFRQTVREARLLQQALENGTAWQA